MTCRNLINAADTFFRVLVFLLLAGTLFAVNANANEEDYRGNADLGEGEWALINNEFGQVRHENAFVQAGDNFYVLGGRESLAVRVYSPSVESWSDGASSPILLHHFQAVELDGLIYIVGAMTGSCCSEPPVENVYIYDPLADAWTTGPEIPAERRRGSSGVVVHDGLIYWISGSELGHTGNASALVDAFDPASGSFTPLAAIPNPRDHFFATLRQNSIYVVGGRKSGEGGSFLEPTIPEVDVYDIAANTWDTLSADANLDPPRAASATALLGDEIVIAGGESGAQSNSHAETQALNPATGQWRDLAGMPSPRHGAQALVSNGGFYVVAGSPTQGGPGGAVLDLEALFLDGQTSPTGEPLTAGSIAAPASVEFESDSETVILSHDGGNQAVIVENLQITGSTAFSLAQPFPGPITIAPGATTEIVVEFDSSNTDSHIATLVITDGKGGTTVVSLEAEGSGGSEPVVLYRVNAGGAQVAAIDGGPDWSADISGSPSQYLAAGGGQTGGFNVLSLESSVPGSTPEAIFESERWDPPEAPEMLWQFPVANGTSVEVRLYLMNGWNGTSEPGQRIFDIQIDGVTIFNGIDLSAEAGHQVGTVRSYQTVSDGTIDIEFIHNVENPLVNGIEIVVVGPQPGVLSASPPGIAFGSVSTDSSATKTITLKNQGESGDPDIEITSFSIAGDFSTTLSTGLTLAPGAETTADVTFSPQSVGQQSNTLSISHDGNNSPVEVSLSGAGFDPSTAPISFSSQTIANLNNPTQMEFGPDGRLYVSELKGLIYAFEIERNEGTGDYLVLDVEVIGLIQTIPNHNDDGSSHSSTQRNVTGMITAGTPENPVLYITSSDPRIDSADADTNSGMLSRLTWTGTEWEKLDLVRSLPRSEHDHLPNGLALDVDTGVLYIALGGHTNMGAPSFSFGNLPEYAYSAAVVSVDLGAIGETTYDIPTLKGPVFGGQFGANQAKLVAGGPVQVHSPGYRNPYDVVLTSSGKLYTWDNGPNSGWGGLPINEGPAGNCTNGNNESGSATHPDGLHYIAAPGYYGGHPNPTRANRDNTFDGQTPIPAGMENTIECDYHIPGVEDSALTTYGASTNGLAEYTASNFGGAMTGNIIATSWNGNVLRVQLNSAGDEVLLQENLFTSLSGPLGITAQGDADPFPGTIWVGQYFNGDIAVFEPNDFVDCDPDNLDPNDTSPNGYTYGDLMDNGLDPCNPAQVPADFDQDFVSDINDEDIDGDGILNQDDIFDFDPDNGRGSSLPHRVAWTSDVVGDLGGMADWSAPGFTGHMLHPTANVSIFDQFDPDNLIPGGAAGIFTVEEVSVGDSWTGQNDQENAFHFGVDVGPDSGIFTVRSRVMTPFAGITPENFQSMGLFIGNGDQDNYIKLVTNANSGAGGIEFAIEVGGSFNGQQIGAPILGADHVDLYLVIDPVALTVSASYVITTDGVRGDRTAAGNPVSIPEPWLTNVTNGLAAGIISTSTGAVPFPASWRFVEVYKGNGEFFPEPGLFDGVLSAQPAALDFESVPVGSDSTLIVDLVNEGVVGDSDITVTDIVVDGDASFTIDFPGMVVIPPGESTSLAVTFAPNASGELLANIVIEHDGVDSPLEIGLSGNGIAPVLAADPVALDFGQVVFQETETRLVTLTNIGDAELLFGEFGLSGDDAGQFGVETDGCSNQSLAPTASCEVVVSLTPDSSGVFTAQLDVPSDALEGPDFISLTGEGVAATATVTLGNLEQIYDGNPKPVTVTTDPEGLSVVVTYDGSETPPIDARNYAVVATVDDANWEGQAEGKLAITPADATVTLDDLEQIYDGDPKPVTVSTDPEGLPVVATYDGSETPPTDAGSYAVVATVTDPNWEGQAMGTLVITPASATVTLGNLEQTYDGNPKPVSVTTDPEGLSVVVTYDGSETPPTDAGSYAVVATVDDPTWVGESSGTLVINPAPQSIDFDPIGDRTTDDPLEFTLIATADSGLPVSFTVLSGPASVDGDLLTLTGEVGTVSVEANQAGGDNWLPADPVAQSFQVIAGDADSVAINDGDGQVGVAGEPLPVSPSVIVTDQHGVPVSGVAVSFEVYSGGGTSSGNSQVTDADGIARVGSWTLGGEPGDQEMIAEAPGLQGSPVVFTARAGDVADLAISGEVSAGEINFGDEITYTLQVSNLDANNNADEVVVSSSLPQGTSLVESSGCAESPAGGAPVCTIGDLPAGANTEIVLTVMVTVQALEVLVFSASVDASQFDPDLGNNTVTLVRDGPADALEDQIFTDRFETSPDP